MKSKAHGYLFALAATTIFSLQDAVSKHLGDHYPPIFVTMIRYWAFGAFCMFLASRKRGGLKAAASTTRPVLQIVRGVLLAVEIMIVITAFAHAGLAHSTAVLSATPILVTLLSIPLLGERVGWRRWSAIIAGLVVALKLVFPALLAGIPELSYGRLRPLHTNAAIFAFAGNAIFVGVYYSLQRLCKARMFSDALSA